MTLPPPPQQFTNVSTSGSGPTIAGTLDGINDTFTVQVILRRMKVFRNGQVMTLNIDCVTGPTVVKFLGDQVPQPGDLLMIQGWL